MYYIMLMINNVMVWLELEKISKESVIDNLRCYPNICPEGLIGMPL
jgi:hypothetical protein